MPCVIGPYRKVYTACLSGHNKLKAILSTKVSKLLSWGLQDRSEDHVCVNAHCLKMIIYLFIYLGIIHQEYVIKGHVSNAKVYLSSWGWGVLLSSALVTSAGGVSDLELN